MRENQWLYSAKYSVSVCVTWYSPSMLPSLRTKWKIVFHLQRELFWGNSIWAPANWQPHRGWLKTLTQFAHVISTPNAWTHFDYFSAFRFFYIFHFHFECFFLGFIFAFLPKINQFVFISSWCGCRRRISILWKKICWINNPLPMQGSYWYHMLARNANSSFPLPNCLCRSRSRRISISSRVNRILFTIGLLLESTMSTASVKFKSHFPEM